MVKEIDLDKMPIEEAVMFMALLQSALNHKLNEFTRAQWVENCNHMWKIVEVNPLSQVGDFIDDFFSTQIANLNEQEEECASGEEDE